MVCSCVCGVCLQIRSCVCVRACSCTRNHPQIPASLACAGIEWAYTCLVCVRVCVCRALHTRVRARADVETPKNRTKNEFTCRYLPGWPGNSICVDICTSLGEGAALQCRYRGGEERAGAHTDANGTCTATRASCSSACVDSANCKKNHPCVSASVSPACVSVLQFFNFCPLMSGVSIY